jgi:hypothetical protein
MLEVRAQRRKPSGHIMTRVCIAAVLQLLLAAHLHVAGHHPAPIQHDQLLSLNEVGRSTLADGSSSSSSSSSSRQGTRRLQLS